MAILMLLEFDGVTVEQYEQVNAHMGIEGDGDAPDGLIAHTAALTDDGLLIVDVWDSEAALQQFVEERLGAAMADAGVAQKEPRILPVHNAIPQGAGTDAGVLMIIESDEFTPELYDRITGDLPSHEGDGSAHPAVSHIAAVADDGGMVFVDIWESPEAFAEFAETVLGPAAEGKDMPELEPRFLPVHDRLRGAARV